MKTLKSRKWLPWELNWLRNYNFSTEKADLEAYGEKPVEYITGWAEFKGLPLKVEAGITLIPRVETEGLVTLIVQEIKRIRAKRGQKTRRLRIADVGTGSGAIALAIAQELFKLNESNFEILASDISGQALDIARRNQELWQIPEENLVFLESDLLDKFSKKNKFDLVVANLPYIPLKRKNTLDESVTAFEPKEALFGGEEGGEVIKKFLHQVPAYLNKQAPVWLEVDDSHKPEQVLDFLKRSINVYPDCNNVNRFWKIVF